MIEHSVWVITHLAGLSLILFTAWGLGNLCVRRVRFHSAAERWVFTTALGLGLCGLALFWLGLLGLLYRGIILGLTVAWGLMTGLQVVRQRGQMLERLRQWKAPRRWRGAVAIGLMAAGVAYWALLLVLSQYPPIHFDAVWSHLVLTRTYLDEHRVVLHSGAGVPVLPALNHLLFAWALVVGDDVLAQMIEHAFMMLTAFGLYAWGTRRHQPALGVGAAALWLAHPLVLYLSGSAYVDMGLTCFVFLGVYALRVFWERGEVPWWLLAMALLGAGAGTKMPGLIFLALGAGLGLWARVRSKLSWRGLAQGALLALFILGPFYAFIAYHTGNPVWPFLPQLSRGVWGSPKVVAWNRGVGNMGIPRTWLNYLSLPFQFVTHPDRFVADRALFPLLIAWPLAWLIACRDRSTRWWSGWVLVFTGCWFLSFHQLRYWLPALPMAGLALCESVRWLLERVRCAAAFRQAVWAGLTLWAVVWGAQSALAEIRFKGWFPVTPQAREEFLAKFLPCYHGARYINQHAGPGDVAYVLNASWLNYYLLVPVIDRNSILDRPIPTFNWPGDEQMVRTLEAQRVAWLLYCPANPLPWKLPTDDPRYRPQWPPYQLVYEDSQVWIYRHPPPPGT